MRRLLILLFALSPLCGCVQMAVRSESTPGLSAALSRPGEEPAVTRAVVEAQARPVPSPADPTLDDDDDDEDEEDATGHGLRRLQSTAR